MAGAALACLLCVTIPNAPQDPAPGIARELAIARKAQLSDAQYHLQFTLDDAAEVVTGRVNLYFRITEDVPPQHDVVLDFAGDALTDVDVNGRKVELRRVEDHAIVPKDLLVRGLNGVNLSFRSKVAATGTPLTVYRDPADGRRYYYTLLVPADARGLFPCFDQPDLRARFQLQLDLPREWTAVSNTAPIDPGQPDPPPQGRLWRFAETKPLPTYLFAFACGPFAEFNARQPEAPGVTATAPMRFLVRASRLGDADQPALVKLHREGLAWLAAAFDVPYPFDKLDAVLVPGFPYGGMEHAGAIFYRETALVFDHPPTAAELVRRSTLVYHELSHQWFGNLVTMRWFDDLWLKEGFATFYGYRALAALEPEQRAWLRFLQRVKPRAYEVDGTPGTTPVYQQLQNLADAKSAYGAIVYNKAPAVLHALCERLGAEVFARGVKAFLEQHAFDNATWQDLADALEDAARQDLDRWSQRWLLAPSMPQVKVAWTSGADGVVTAAQVTQRATEGGDGTWPLDLELLVFAADGSHRIVTVHSDAAATDMPELVGQPEPVAVLANPDDVAYGQFVPDAKSGAWLLDHAPELTEPLVRACATAALFEGVREAELDPAAFAALGVRLCAAERDPDTHGWLLSMLTTCLERYLDAERAAPLRRALTDLLLQQLHDEAGSGRELTTFRVLARHSADERVLALCKDVVADRALPDGLKPGKEDCFLAAAALLAAGAKPDDADDPFAQLERRFLGQDIGKELFLARAATPTEASKQQYFARYLEPDDPPEQWTQDSLTWFHWPGQDALTLPFLQRALEQVDWVKQHRRIFFMPAWLDAFINGHSSAAALAIVDTFVADHALGDDVRQKLLQSRDGLARAVRVRSRDRKPPIDPQGR